MTVNVEIEEYAYLNVRAESFQPPEKQTHNYPGCPAEMEDVSVWLYLDGVEHDITDAIPERMMEVIKSDLLQQFIEDQEK